jgi:hypothetical protein
MRIDLRYMTPVDPTEPQHAAALFKCVNDQIERVGPCGEIRIELEGVRHLGEYEVLEPDRLVYLLLVSPDVCYGMLAPSETPGGKPEIHFELPDLDNVVLNDGAMAGNA